MKVPSAGTIERFYLLAYSDNYRNNLIGNWLIELNSLSGLDLKYHIYKKKYNSKKKIIFNKNLI